MKTSLDIFLNELIENTGLKINKELSVEGWRHIIAKINEYFYTTYPGIGQTQALDNVFEYFSEFHKFWELYHEKIINPKIDEQQCIKVGKILNGIYLSNKKVFYDLYNTYTLAPNEICKIRYFAANQDFRGTRDFEDLFKKYSDDPTVFDITKINKSPEDFLKNIGITSLSQSDKRIKYAVTASQILIDKKIEPYDLFDYFDKDLLKIRNFLISTQGFGNKKTDMFIRDMIVLGVWKQAKNFDKIDVASDINTIKVALRTGIIKTSIPLVSSFLDIFCYQYGLIDKISALAWRKVWEKWNAAHPESCIESPSLMDYFVYRIIGKEFCKESLCVFQCESGEHEFKWHSGRNKTCQICKDKKAFVIKKILPCADIDGNIVISKNEFVAGHNAVLKGITECPFATVCESKSSNFIKLNPPKLISILRQTRNDDVNEMMGLVLKYPFFGDGEETGDFGIRRF